MNQFQLAQIDEVLRKELSERKTPVKIMELLLQILRSQFSNFDNYQWDEDENKSNIIIDISNISEERLETAKPTIFIKRGTLGFSRIGMDNLREIDLRDAKLTYQISIGGQFAIFCISSALLEAEKIGLYVFDIMQVFAPIIEKIFHFKSFRMDTMGEAGVIEDAKDKYLVPIILAFNYEESWRISKESVKLRTVNIDPSVETDTGGTE